MIYVEIFYNSKDTNLVDKIVITYPDTLKPDTVVPHGESDTVTYEEGKYIQQKGFFPNVLEIRGKNRNLGTYVIIMLPMASCIIKKYLE